MGTNIVNIKEKRKYFDLYLILKNLQINMKKSSTEIPLGHMKQIFVWMFPHSDPT